MSQLNSNCVKIFDTTLRDGEQSPGATMNVKEKLQIAQQLEKMNVDIIEAGFPVSSLGDFDSVQTIGQNIGSSTICALARCAEKDIIEAEKALKYAQKKRIHVFIATSEIHRKYKLKKSPEDVLKMAVCSVRHASSLVNDVEFSAEDASRTELPFLAKIVEAVIDAGAKTVNIPDTVGYATPFDFSNIIVYLKKNVPNIEETVLSVHCHDDLGMAVANSFSAVYNGVRQVECAVNGIGERAGNCSIEEIVMALKTRQKTFGFFTNVVSQEICKTSKMVSRITGLSVQANKAIVGVNAFAHEAGIHQDGMLKNRNTYEIMDPKDVGWGESSLVLGKHSGRHAFDEKLKILGYQLDQGDREKLFFEFKKLCDKKKVIYNEDLLALLTNVLDLHEEALFSLESVNMEYIFSSSVHSKAHLCKVSVKNNKTKKMLCGNGKGEGPINAVVEAISHALDVRLSLLSYNMYSVTSGRDALGEVIVKVKIDDVVPVYTGRFVSVDVLEGGAQALLNACEPYFVSHFLKKKSL